ncbi:MAG: hypothetical protein JW808_01020, partial [Victivallales bacterium]|nr:hypothetical protein [Victivallales bacterium]
LEKSVNFGADLPEFRSPNGFLEDADPRVRHADPLMWVAALEKLFGMIKEDGFDLSRVECVSGSGQQHGSVYLNERFKRLSGWGTEGIVDLLPGMLSRMTSPIWMDSSTSAECEEIAQSVGGSHVVCETTGSIPIERFTGPQIRRFFKERPEDYSKTAVIHLVSSFMASVLAGRSLPIDYGDGAGMNLLNLKTLDWDSRLLDATAPSLRDKLPPAASSKAVAGKICAYFVNKYGFSPDCGINIWSGDNPNSLVGLGGSESGTAIISLGTSDTFMASFDKPFTDPNGYGHVFCNPAGGFMCLICFKNGSLARENVKKEFGMEWKQFDVEAFARTPAGNNGNMMVPFYLPETTPRTLNPRVEFRGEDDFVSRKSPDKAARAIVESQMANMRINSEWTNLSLRRIKVTGGASRSDEICRTIANIFQTPVERFSVSNSAGLGAALRAANAATDRALSELASDFNDASRNTVFNPEPEKADIYSLFVEDFRGFLLGKRS